jgi:hypothetical protein
VVCEEGEVKAMLKRALAIIIGLVIAVGVAPNCVNQNVQAQSQKTTRAREVAKTPPAEVTVTLNEQFFNALLETIFTNMKAPTFPLSLATNDQKKNRSDEISHASFNSPNVSLSYASVTPDVCESAVTLERESGGVKTAVRFEDGRILAPLAFKGSYSIALIGCVYFRGWADTAINLSFDRQRQVLSAHVTVEDIHLDNIPSLASGVIIRLVQNSLDSRINPIEILQAAQISTRLPIAGSGGALRMRATEIRPEVLNGALSLHIFYEFTPAE